MKNKYVMLSLVIITSFSISSCKNHEKKISPDAGNDLLQTVRKASNVHFSDLKNKDFISSAINGKTNGNFNYTISYPNDPTKEKIENKFEFDIEFDYKANQDVKGIRSTPSNLTNCESYLSTKYNINNNEKVDVAAIKVHQTGNNLSIYEQYYEDAPENKTKTLSNDEINEYCETFIYLLDELNEKKFIKGFLPNIDDVDYERIKLQYQKFDANEIDAQEFIDYIDFYVFSRDLFDNTPEGTYEFVVKLLESKEEILPSNFIDYTKVATKTSTTLKGIFDYKDWGLSVKDTLTKIEKELKEENSSFEMISSLQSYFLEYLPSQFSFSYSITFDANNVITGGSVDFIAVGDIENFPLAITNQYPNLKGSKLDYDIQLSFNISCLISEEIIEILPVE